MGFKHIHLISQNSGKNFKKISGAFLCSLSVVVLAFKITYVMLMKRLKTIYNLSVNHNSLDNKDSWRILKDFYCSVTMLYKESGLKGK